jgi:hypothetical protein
MKMYGEVKVQHHTLLTSALDGSERSASCHNNLLLRRKPQYLIKRGQVGTIVCLNVVVKRKIPAPARN